MNERIKELADEARIKFSSHWAHEGVDTAVIVRRDLIEFAELIVQQCLNMCAESDSALQRIQDGESSSDSESLVYGAADYEYAEEHRKRFEHYESIACSAKSAGDKIREYFGVDES